MKSFAGTSRPLLVFASLQGMRVDWLPRDLLAGLVLAAIAVPEQLATAQLAGLPPETGLIAFVTGSLAFAVFGVSRFLSSGADSTIAPIFAGGLAAFAAIGSPDYAHLAALLALMVGAIMVAAGCCGRDGLLICCQSRSRPAFSPGSRCTSQLASCLLFSAWRMFLAR